MTEEGEVRAQKGKKGDGFCKSNYEPPYQTRQGPPLGEIKTIARGFARGGLTSSNRKAHVRRAHFQEVYVVEQT